MATAWVRLSPSSSPTTWYDLTREITYQWTVRQGMDEACVARLDKQETDVRQMTEQNMINAFGGEA